MYVQKIKRWCIMSDTLKKLNQIAAILELAAIATLKRKCRRWKNTRHY